MASRGVQMRARGLSLPALITIALYGAAVLQFVLYRSRLPEQVATHFAGDGTPNNWSTRSVFLLVYLALLCGSAMIWIVVAVLLRSSRLSGFNLPHREFWLAPERREQTLAFLRRWFWWLGAALTGALVGSFQAVIRANLRPVPHLDNRVFHLLFGPFLVFTALWSIGLLLRFRLPRSARAHDRQSART